VVASTAAALKLLLWGDTCPEWEGVAACQAPRCVAAVTFREPEALAAFALQRSIRGAVRLYRNLQTAEFGE